MKQYTEPRNINTLRPGLYGEDPSPRLGFRKGVVLASHLVSTDNLTELEFGMYPQSMPTEWTRARTLRRWQSVRLYL